MKQWLQFNYKRVNWIIPNTVWMLRRNYEKKKKTFSAPIRREHENDKNDIKIKTYWQHKIYCDLNIKS